MMRRTSIVAALAAAVGIGAAVIPGASHTSEARAGFGGGFGGDFVAIDACGTIQEVPLFLFGMPYGTCKVWVENTGGPFGGLTVNGGLLNQFDAGDQVYIEGSAILAITNVYPRCPGFPLVEATFSEGE